MRGFAQPALRHMRRVRWTLLLGLLLTYVLSANHAAAQPRDANPVEDLSTYILDDLVASQEGAVRRCASRGDTGAYVANVAVDVRPGARPSTLYNASITVSVRSRARDLGLEGCVRDAVRDALRHAAYAVPRAVRSQRTFQIDERTPPREPDPPPAYREAEVHAALDRASLSSCLGMAGVPDEVALRVAVEADGRLTLMNANLPSAASSDALSCLATRVSHLRVEARPARRVNVTHSVGVRSRAW